MLNIDKAISELQESVEQEQIDKIVIEITSDGTVESINKKIEWLNILAEKQYYVYSKPSLEIIKLIENWIVKYSEKDKVNTLVSIGICFCISKEVLIKIVSPYEETIDKDLLQTIKLSTGIFIDPWTDLESDNQKK